MVAAYRPCSESPQSLYIEAVANSADAKSGAVRIGVLGHHPVPAAVQEIVRCRAPEYFGQFRERTIVTTLKPGAPQMLAQLAGASLEVVVPAAVGGF